jgi:hypothetical protein
MKIVDHLSDKQIKQLKTLTSPENKKKPPELSRRDIEELMGVNRDIYVRGKGGAVRRK